MIYSSPDEIPKDIANNLDVILVLGGGVPIDPNSPPVYVQKRCHYAAQVYASVENPKPSILALSAGTAHLPQLISSDGLPVWESTATASYLMKIYDVDPGHIYVETTSYDTISNAFFARTNFCDIASWKQLLIITNEFHMERTKLIFDWIMKAPSDTSGSTDIDYKLYYLSVPNDGISNEALRIRQEKESKSAQNVKHVLMKQYTSTYDIWMFLTQQHSFYNAQMLVDRANIVKANIVEQQDFQMLRQSYGGSFNHSRNASKGIPWSIFIGGLMTGAVLPMMWIFLFRHTKGLSKIHST